MLIAVADVDVLVRNWWVVLLRGIAAILFGLFTFFAPAISLAALVILFGAYAFVDGALAIASALRGRDRSSQPWGLLLLHGVAGIAAGLITLFMPGITALALLYLIASWALVTGVLEIAGAVRLRKAIEHEWLFVLGGIASVALGVLLMLFPADGALALVLWIGAYAFVFGALLVALSFRLRSWGSAHGRHTAAHAVA